MRFSELVFETGTPSLSHIHPSSVRGYPLDFGDRTEVGEENLLVKVKRRNCFGKEAITSAKH